MVQAIKKISAMQRGGQLAKSSSHRAPEPLMYLFSFSCEIRQAQPPTYLDIHLVKPSIIDDSALHGHKRARHVHIMYNLDKQSIRDTQRSVKRVGVDVLTTSPGFTYIE